MEDDVLDLFRDRDYYEGWHDVHPSTKEVRRLKRNRSREARRRKKELQASLTKSQPLRGMPSAWRHAHPSDSPPGVE